MCVDGFILECPPPPFFVYLVLGANDQVRRFINIGRCCQCTDVLGRLGTQINSEALEIALKL